MECPNCKHELKKIPYNDINLAQCINCGGMWFDKGELRAVKDKEDEFLQWLDVDLFPIRKRLRADIVR